MRISHIMFYSTLAVGLFLTPQGGYLAGAGLVIYGILTSVIGVMCVRAAVKSRGA
mgnify:CR=1 FL=1